ncbi:MAG: hypothetical protein FJW88_07775 [Actinobacteria bacterium]|nr:hypothetical protein [Actinomycetota bacterium]
MRRYAALILLVTAVSLGACRSSESASSGLPRPSRAFCEAAGRYDEKVGTRTLSMRQHVEYLTDIATTAPADIEDEAELVLDAMRRRADGDVSVVDDPEVEASMQAVTRRAGQDCGWYERQGL